MRVFSKGQPFIEVPAEGHEKDRMPVFSEAFLYPHVGKSDARFILAVAEEYAHVINILGTTKVQEILARKR